MLIRKFMFLYFKPNSPGGYDFNKKMYHLGRYTAPSVVFREDNSPEYRNDEECEKFDK